MPTLFRYKKVQCAWRAERIRNRRKINQEKGYKDARRYRRMAILESKPIVNLRGIRRELMNRKSGLLKKMEQKGFDDLMEATKRCVQEAETLVEREFSARRLSKRCIRSSIHGRI